jgi:hypothetical protein
MDINKLAINFYLLCYQLKNLNLHYQGDHHDGSFHTYFAHKITKLQNANQIDEDEILSDIFKNCYVFINGSTEPPIEGAL